MVERCSSKRAIFTLRCLGLQRNTMDNQLNGFALNIHRDIRSDSADIMDKVAEKPRRVP